MRLFLFLLLTISTLPAQAAWIVKSEFQLLLSEKLFDEMIGDFWQSLQGTQNIPIGNFTITPGGIPIQIQGVRTEVNYSFSTPGRVDERSREWKIHSENLGARLLVDRISATQTIVRVVDGITIRIRLQADCHNVALRLPPGLTRVEARIRAELSGNQVRLSLPHYGAEWKSGAWQVESMHCTGLEGFEQIVREEALKALSSFQNFDAEVKTALNDNFAKWSRDASLLLLSERELPSTKDYVKIFYEPKLAEENSAGLLLGGELRFEYPYVAPGQWIENSYVLQPGSGIKPQASPQLLLPFATLRALMMGEYFAGKLEYSLRSKELPAFTEFMQSRWKQFWAFPELMRYKKNTPFAFQFLPMGPPSFTGERANGANAITGELSLPLSLRLFAPISGKYRPMVEFKTLVAGPTNLKLLKGGKVEFQLKAKKHKVDYDWADTYVKNHRPTERIAIDTIAEHVRSALKTEGFTMEFPSLTVGKSLKLAPENWNLEGTNLRLDFSTKK